MVFCWQNSSGVQLLSLKTIPESDERKKDNYYGLDSTKESIVTESGISINRFVFNPNTITPEDAQALGFSKKLSTTLIHFRAKGGKFYKPDDLKKLYGMTPALFDELQAYILIPNTNRETKKYQEPKIVTFFKPDFDTKKNDNKLLEINSADSLAIISLKGIGPAFTKRIIRYRALLGGFHSLQQLKEVYGMTDSLFSNLAHQIQINKNAITKIRINTVDFHSLKKHPYIHFQTAQAIINYRTKHGQLSENDLVNLGVLSEEQLAKLLPYFIYD